MKKKTYWNSRPPPHHGKFHQKIPFAFSDCFPNQGSIHIFYKVLSEFKVTDMRGLWSYLNPIKMWTNSEKQLSSHCQAESAPQPLSSAFFNIEISNSTKSSNVTKFVLASLTAKVTSVKFQQNQWASYRVTRPGNEQTSDSGPIKIIVGDQLAEIP